MSIAEKLTTVAGNVPKVYEAGKNEEWSSFWDAYQQNGNRRHYAYAFRNTSNVRGWNKTNFKPKYDIICEGDAEQCFYSWGDQTAENAVNIGEILKKQGITIDTSRATNLTNFMAYGYMIVGELPTISFESAGSNTIGAFHGVKVTKIEKVIVTEDTNFQRFFIYNGNLEEVIFEGVIAKGNLDMKDSRKLNAKSLKSIIDCLSPSTTGLTVTLPSTAEANYNANPPEGAPQTWAELVATKSNWTIAYA